MWYHTYFKLRIKVYPYGINIISKHNENSHKAFVTRKFNMHEPPEKSIRMMWSSPIHLKNPKTGEFMNEKRLTKYIEYGRSRIH